MRRRGFLIFLILLVLPISGLIHNRIDASPNKSYLPEEWLEKFPGKQGTDYTYKINHRYKSTEKEELQIKINLIRPQSLKFLEIFLSISVKKGTRGKKEKEIIQKKLLEIKEVLKVAKDFQASLVKKDEKYLSFIHPRVTIQAPCNFVEISSCPESEEYDFSYLKNPEKTNVIKFFNKYLSYREQTEPHTPLLYPPHFITNTLFTENSKNYTIGIYLPKDGFFTLEINPFTKKIEVVKFNDGTIIFGD